MVKVAPYEHTLLMQPKPLPIHNLDVKVDVNLNHIDF